MINDFPLWDRFGWLLRILAAHGPTFLFLILNLVSFSIPYAGEVRPFFFLMVVYYWAVYRPTLLPPAMTFALGLLIDLLSGLPPGLNAFVLLAAQWIVRNQRLYLMGQSYIMVWLGFALVCLLAAAAQWLVFGLVTLSLPYPGPILASIVLSIFLFPFFSLLLIMVHRILPVASKPYR